MDAPPRRYEPENDISQDSFRLPPVELYVQQLIKSTVGIYPEGFSTLFASAVVISPVSAGLEGTHRGVPFIMPDYTKSLKSPRSYGGV